MEAKITKFKHGYKVQVGKTIAGNIPLKENGCSMIGFIVYESSVFDTLKQAKNFIRRVKNVRNVRICFGDN